MACTLSLRVSWICVLLFSSAACFPATKGDYRYPYTATWGSSGGAAPGSNLEPEGSRYPEVLSPSAAYDSGAPRVPHAPSVTYDSGAPLVPQAPSEAYDSGDGVASYGNPSGPALLPWPEQPVWGVAASFNPADWIPSRSFPDFSVWDANDQMPQSVSETSPLLPSSYIIQSRNGYQRARQVQSHTRYTNDPPPPPVFVEAPSKSAPMAPSKGGKKV